MPGVHWFYLFTLQTITGEEPGEQVANFSPQANFCSRIALHRGIISQCAQEVTVATEI